MPRFGILANALETSQDACMKRHCKLLIVYKNITAVDSGVLGFMGFMMIERIAKLIITTAPVARV